MGDYISSILADETEPLESRLDTVETILLDSTEKVRCDGCE